MFHGSHFWAFFSPHYSGIPNNPLILLSSASHVSSISAYTRILVFVSVSLKSLDTTCIHYVPHRTRGEALKKAQFCSSRVLLPGPTMQWSSCFPVLWKQQSKCSCGCSPNRLKLPRTVKNCFSCFVDALTASDVLKKSETTCAFESISEKVNCFADLRL